MKITVTESMFKDQFKAYGREDNFSRKGLEELFVYLDDGYEEELELDIIGICCDFTEDDYSSIADDYDISLSHCEGDEGEEFEAVLDYLEKNTMVVYSDSETGMILYQDF